LRATRGNAPRLERTASRKKFANRSDNSPSRASLSICGRSLGHRLQRLRSIDRSARGGAMAKYALRIGINDYPGTNSDLHG
jgi:hypothetical protein